MQKLLVGKSGCSIYHNYSMKIILCSNSPRRKELLSGLGLDYGVRVVGDIDESYPHSMPAKNVAQYIAEKKADAYTAAEEEIILTADTVVIVDNEILGKPKDGADAARMLRLISGRTHQVITGVCLKNRDKRISFSVSTDVTFKLLSEDEISYYIEHYRPFDKAGAYGIQEWIGFIGVTELNGSYFNVMGLPVQRIYDALVNQFGVSVE